MPPKTDPGGSTDQGVMPDYGITDEMTQRQAESASWLNQRASWLPMDFVKDAPWLASWLVTSPLPHQHVETIGRGLRQGWPWLKSLNGPDGQYMADRGAALLEPDQEFRRQRLESINAAVENSYFGDTEVPPVTAAPSRHGRLAVPSMEGGPEAPGGQLDPGQLAVAGKRLFLLGLQSDMPDGARKGALAALGVANGLDTPEALGSFIDQVSRSQYTKEDVTGLVPATAEEQDYLGLGTKFWKPRGSIGQILSEALSIAARPDMASLIFAPAATLAFDAVGHAIQGGTQAAAGSLSAVGLKGAAEEARKVGRFGEKVVGWPGDVFGRASDLLGGGVIGIGGEIHRGIEGKPASVRDWWDRYAWPHEMGSGAGQAMVDAVGLSPDSRMGQIVSDLTNLATQWAASGFIMKSVAGYRFGGKELMPEPPGPETPPEQAQGYSDYIKDLDRRYTRVGRVLAQIHQRLGGPLGPGIDNVKDWVMKDSRGMFVDIQKIADEHPKEAVDRIVTASHGRITPEMAQVLVDAPTIPEKQRAYLDVLAGQAPTDSATTERLVREIDEKLSDTTMTSQARDWYEAERLRLAWRKSNYDTMDVSYQIPKLSTVRMLVQNFRDSPVSGVLKDRLDLLLYTSEGGPRIPVPHVSRLFDRIYSRGVENWIGPDARPGALTRSYEKVKTDFERAGVPKPISREILGRMTRIGSRAELDEWVKEAWAAIRSSKAIASDMKIELDRAFGYANEADWLTYPKKYPDGRTVYVPVIEGPGFVGRPGMSSQWANQVPWPDIEQVTDATSWSRRMDRLAENHRLTKPLHWTYATAKAVAQASTDILKPTVLVGRMPAIVERAGIEHRLRYIMKGVPFGGGKGAVSRLLRGGGSDTGLFDLPIKEGTKNVVDESALGQLAYDTLQNRGKPLVVTRKYKGEPLDRGGYGGALVDKIDQMAAAPEVVAMVRFGGDMGKWLDWMHGDGEKYGLAFEPDLKWAGMNLTDYGRNLKAAIDGVAGESESVRQMILTQELGDVAVPKNELGETYRQEHDRLDESIENAYPAIVQAQQRSMTALSEERYKDHYDQGALARALTKQRADDIARRKWLREHMGDVEVDPNVRAIRIGDRDAVLSRLEAMRKAGEYTPPAEVVSKVWQLDGRSNVATRLTRQIGDAIYRPLKWVGKMDQRISREPFWRIRSREIYDEQRAWGRDEEFSRHNAELKAARETQDFFYNLTARTSTDRYLRNVFWFLPIAESALRSWLVDIPSTYYWPLGLGYEYARAHMVIQTLKKLGMIHDVKGSDGKNHPFTPLPLGGLYSKFFGLDVLDPLHPSFDPKQISLLTSTSEIGPFSIPQLSIPYAYALQTMARDHGGLLKSFADFMMPGGVSQWAPTWSLDAYEAITGKPAAWGYLSEGKQRAVESSSYFLAQNMAYQALTREGKTAPDFNAYVKGDRVDEAGYKKALQSWFNELDAETTHVYRFVALYHLAGATVLPAPLHMSDAYTDDYNAMWQDLKKTEPPKDSPLYAAWKQTRDQRLTKYATDHPFGFAYTVPHVEYDTPIRPIPGRTEKELSFYDQVYTGYRRVLDPETRMKMFAGWESYDHFRLSEQDAIAQAIGKPWEQVQLADVLTNWNKYELAVQNGRDSWNRYINDAANTGFRSEFVKSQKNAPGYGLEKLLTALGTMRQLENSAVGDETYSDIRVVMGTLGDQIRTLEHAETTSPGSSGFAAGLNYYYKNVLQPYFDEVRPLQDAIKQAKASGGDLNPLYTKLRDINVKWDTKTVSYQGQDLPSPEKMFFGNRPTWNQEDTKLKWTLRSPAWLTPFQRQIVGYPDVPGFDQFLDWQSGFEDYFQQGVRKLKQAGGLSQAYDKQLQAWHDQVIDQHAGQVSPAVQKAWRVSQASPYERLTMVEPWLQSNKAWQQTVDLVLQIDALAASQNPPASTKSDSAFMTQYKEILFSGFSEYLDPQSRYYDRQIAELFQRLESAAGTQAMPMRAGSNLLDAVFFDNFSPYGYTPTYYRQGG